MHAIKLNKGKDKAAGQRHPWVFSGAIAQVIGKPKNGELVEVLNANDVFVAYGYYNDASRVAVRLLEWDRKNTIDEAWWRTRLRQAVAARQGLLGEGNDTIRLVFSEADFLPGLIVDKFGDFVSVQVLTSGMERIKPILVDELKNLLSPKGIYERSDAAARAHDGLAEGGDVLYGLVPPDFVEICENGIKYLVSIVDGQKSGFYCDQRDNRLLLARHAAGKKVLDCFCYSGGFTLNALKMGASEVHSVDSSALAIETLNRNITLNGFEAAKHVAVQAEVNKQLRKYRDEGEQFDIVVLDPPKYAPSRSSLEKAARAYKDLNRQGLLLLQSGGLLATFSCSAAMDMATFKQVLAWAALDAGKEIQFIHQFCQPEDHPVRSSFPEGEYLKGLLCRVL